jgi:DNA adenine methylase
MNPIVRWAGSKRQLLHKLRRYWLNSDARYVEPFCGSACLFFDLEPASAVLGDLNSELIATYRAVRDNAGLVVECMRRLRLGEASYYKIRAIDPILLSEAETAARFLYLNRNCFNGIYRTNQSGRFNVPYAAPKSKSKRRIDVEHIASAARLLDRATLVNGDFESTLERVERGDFVYIDPPYAVADRRIFAEYQADTFCTADLERLESCLEHIDRKGAVFVLSYADSREARRTFARWQPKRVRAKRHIAGFAAKRRTAIEIIASNLKDATYVG